MAPPSNLYPEQERLTQAEWRERHTWHNTWCHNKKKKNKKKKLSLK
ncbi:hypothetical protein OK016_22455 [Vibrio chagasii]|nr:hypothetical protein [Vibrio chagasii]